MPIDLSWKQVDNTGNFYSPLHATMEEASEKSALPPTSAEFESWLRQQQLPADTRVLDAGCGLHGFNLRSCQRAGLTDLFGLDLNEEAIQHLSAQRPEFQLQVGSVLELPYPDSHFDLVICTGVAHHTPDPAQAVREVARVLRPGGCAYVGLYAFAGSLADYSVRAMRRMGRLVPARIAHRMFRWSKTLNNFALDHAYVPILWLFRAEEVYELLDSADLDLEHDFATSFDVFHGRRGLGWVVGDGLVRMFVASKRAHEQT